MRPLVLLLLSATALATNAQWVSIPTGTLDELESVIIIDAQTYIVAGEDGAVFRTTDGGASWSSVAGMGNETVRDFLRLDDQVILGASSGFMVRSTDNGTTWTSISTPAPDDLHAIARSGSTVLAVGREGGIIRSEDLGLTWTAQSSGTNERLFAAWAFDGQHQLAAGKNGVAMGTVNGGATWTATALPGGDDWDGMLFLPDAPAIGLVCGEDGTLLRSTDSGASWSVVGTGSPMGLTAIGSANDGTIYVTGTTGTALKSTDQGLTWSVMTSPSLFSLNGIDVRDGTAVAVGANGTVLKLGNGSIGIDEAAALPATALYPNPANDRLNLQWDAAPTGGLAEVRALDGRLVRTERFSGTQRSLDVGGLANGRYQLVLTDVSGMRMQGAFAVAH